jgi:hypothetical protein
MEVFLMLKESANFRIAHLSDPERMFFVTLLLEQILTWVRHHLNQKGGQKSWYKNIVSRSVCW